jgi:hypothetical protein
MPVRWALFDPRNSDWALIATELGVWSTDNLNGASTDWQPTNSGLANVRVDMLQYRSSDRTIAAATHGRGLFTAVVPASTTPDISFSALTASATEQTTSTTGCRSYTDYSVNMLIANAPTGDATITVNVQAGATASNNVDFIYTTNGNFDSPGNSFVFTSGSTSPHTINIRIYDDAEVEGPQLFTLNYTISGVTNAQPGTSNQTYTFTINDNDTAPVGPYSQTIWSENWDGAIAGWFTQQPGSGNRNNWVVGTGCNVNIAGNTAQVARIQGGSTFCGYGTNAGTIYIYKQVDATLYTSIQVQFNYRAGGDGVNDYGRVVYSTDGGSNWLNLSGLYFNQATTYAALVNLPASLNNSSFLLGWSFTADAAGGNQASSFGIDDIVVSGTRQGTPVESVLNSTCTQELGPNADVYFYSSSGNLIARIQNLSSHDYGCTSVQIDRAGTSGSQFWNTNIANYLMNKSFRVIPTNNNSSGQYAITFYFTLDEVNGWQTATGQSWGNIQLVKLPSQISNVTPANPEPDGAGTVQVVSPTLGTLGPNYTINYTFSNGFSGFGAGIPGASGPLPVTLLSFTGKLQKENVLLEWTTGFEQNSRGFEIEKSFDGAGFHKIGFVSSANSINGMSYNFTDPQKAAEYNYYRLKLVDIDNTFKYSDVVLVKNNNSKQDVLITANPFIDNLTFRFSQIPNGKVTVSVYDIKGSRIYKKAYTQYNQPTITINLAGKPLATGIYSVKVETEEKVYNLKAMKQ